MYNFIAMKTFTLNPKEYQAPNLCFRNPKTGKQSQTDKYILQCRKFIPNSEIPPEEFESGLSQKSYHKSQF